MCPDMTTLRIVVALAQDTSDLRADLLEAVEKLNQVALAENRQGKVEIVAWWVEGTDPGFFRESPHLLIQKIRHAHNPDVIIGVFWRRFGSDSLGPVSDIEHVLEQASKDWAAADHPILLLYFCENTPPNLTEDERRDQRPHIIRFRGLFSVGTFWWPFKKRSEFRKTPRGEELGQIVRNHLLQFIRKWKIDESGTSVISKPRPELDLREEEWTYLDQLDLLKLRGELGEGLKLKEEDAISYFNGEEPRWRYVVSNSIARRKAVKDIKSIISEAAYEKRLCVTLLRGPGGEGKSTILQQVAVDLTDNYPNIHVIWRKKADGAFDQSLIRQLLNKSDSFVLICDNAAMIAQAVYETADQLKDKPHVNIQFLLASQTTEWEWRKAPPDSRWRRALGEKNFTIVPVRKLDIEDARLIIEKWSDIGPQGLGILAQVPESERAQHLVSLAYEEELNDPNEGPLLGAMLSARTDDNVLQGYVKDTLARLEKYTLPDGRTLQHVFAYIAAVHADMAAMRAKIAKGLPDNRRNFPKPVLLSKPILARALSCSLDYLEEAIITPLADEAATSKSGYFVMVRHRRIAEVAKRILAEKSPSRFYPGNKQGIYPELIRAARLAFLPPHNEIDGFEIDPWNNLPRYFFEQGQLEMALTLAEVLADVEPYDPFPVVSWAHIYRDAEKKSEAVEIFRGRFDILLEHWKRRRADPDANAYSNKKSHLNKGYFSEWSVSEGQIGNHCFATWLCGIALSDHFDERRPDDTPFMMLLSELTSSLASLFEKADRDKDRFYDPSHARTFLSACVAAAWLGMDPRAQKHLKESFSKDKATRNLSIGERLRTKHELPAMTGAGDALKSLKAGIILAWELRGGDEGELPSTLPGVDELKFQKIAALLSEEGKSGGSDSMQIKTPSRREF
ncbi:MAG TPA: hypothetical protein VE262_02605 [Blastocatellia bacterium]|nr:hypothetical protein [Blastocatellia bacterium]